MVFGLKIEFAVFGYITASTALKRLNGYTGKNHFYKRQREVGRVFKTERILKFMSDKPTRSSTIKFKNSGGLRTYWRSV